MSNYGQQPPNPYQQNPYGQPGNPYQQGQPQPGQAPGPQPQGPYGQPVQYGQRPGYGQPPQQGQPPQGQPQPPQQGQPDPYGQQNPYQQGPQHNPYGEREYRQPPPQQGQWIAQTPARPTVAPRPIPVVTLDALPGREIAEIVGDVVGVVARGRDLPPELRGGGLEAGYVSMLTRSRQDAIARAVEMATSAGADAILGLRFDCSEITQNMSEVVAYGTAVKLAPLEGEEVAETADSAVTPASAASAAEPSQQWGPPQGQPAGGEAPQQEQSSPTRWPAQGQQDG